jgi:hypothetical protein
VKKINTARKMEEGRNKERKKEKLNNYQGKRSKEREEGRDKEGKKERLKERDKERKDRKWTKKVSRRENI